MRRIKIHVGVSAGITSYDIAASLIVAVPAAGERVVGCLILIFCFSG
jgi:hypothetical protein